MTPQEAAAVQTALRYLKPYEGMYPDCEFATGILRDLLRPHPEVPDWKVGDRVRCVGAQFLDLVGKVGEVAYLVEDKDWVAVRFDDYINGAHGSHGAYGVRKANLVREDL